MPVAEPDLPPGVWRLGSSGVTVPPYGGDTCWTNLAVAYDQLSETLRGFLDGLRAVHRFTAPAEAKNVNEGTMTAEPGSASRAFSGRSRASVPLATPIACFTPI